jgi:hypothetical protein
MIIIAVKIIFKGLSININSFVSGNSIEEIWIFPSLYRGPPKWGLDPRPRRVNYFL